MCLQHEICSLCIIMRCALLSLVSRNVQYEAVSVSFEHHVKDYAGKVS